MGCGESQQCPMGRASSALALPMGILRALGGREAIDREEVFIISERIPSSAHKSARERSPCFALSPFGCLPWVLKGGEESNPKNEMHARILAFHM